ncbi:oxygen-dependent tRNA uridine(34) hydroxylase TrhO [Sphingomonas radiodurans]|uniref:oxygen-dependent tRNA uridine(34) hydroxylase TrhO n=1 Tax=Sphingomonas radiodurans TaxID=2890321 RepID=UPI001E2BB80E|nr:rhodanese-related sulfurtransferase [Sphingomonas radiodurans]WBH17234.1 rhodanese-related sulfurtransferase [Sphingomonas radiodurans]
MTSPIQVAALYHFASFDDPAALREPLEALCRANGVRGTLLLAREGVNGTIAGAPDAIERVLGHLRALPGCVDLPVKYASAETMPFHRLKVRLKQEIVSMGEPDVDPANNAGTYVAPAEWNALIARPDTIVIDTRNDYEVAIGSFPGAIDPGTRSFREFPGWFRANREALLADGVSKVAMFCTGGIRCEKATAFLKAEGVTDVYHLQGGVLNYLEHVPAAESRWDGECFVFDERVAVGHDLAPGTHALCRACRMPVSAADRESALYELGLSCPRCHDARDARQREGYAERHRQVQLAEARGERHVGERQGD